MLLASLVALIDLQSTTAPFCSAFQPSTLIHQSTRRRHHNSFDIGISSRRTRSNSSKLDMVPDTEVQQQLSTSISTITSSLLLSEDGSVESWRQYVPLVVSVGVILDILLGSPLANLALAPMKRASEQGSGGESDDTDGGSGGGSLFSSFGGGGGEDKALSRSKERVDSEAIAQAALDKATGTLELKRFLEENKSDEERYEDVRKKIDRQIQELDD